MEEGELDLSPYEEIQFEILWDVICKTFTFINIFSLK